MQTSSVRSPDGNTIPYDLTLIPLQDTAVLLREVGEKLLVSLLREESRPVLTAYISSQLSQRLALPRGAVVSKSEITYADLLSQSVYGQLSKSAWIGGVGGRVARAIGLDSSQLFPDIAWPLVAELAWHHLDVQHRVAGWIHEYLHTRTFILPGERSLAQLSLKTFWVLIALSAATQSNLPRRASQEERWHYTAASHLQEIAQRQALTPDWAGFWDQWVLLKALQAWQPKGTTLDVRFFHALLALPLVRLAAPELSNKLLQEQQGLAPGTAIKLATPEWKEEMPKWFSV